MKKSIVQGCVLWAILALSWTALAAEKTVAVDGSSTVYPITEAIAEEFQKANPGTEVTVGISGTGGGFKRFVRGEIDINNASRPISSTEAEACKTNGIEYIELPVAFDAIVVAVHPENTWVDYLTVEELKKLWEPEAQGKVLFWDQIRPGWPHEKITLFGPGVDSGTFDYFTEAIVGKAKKSRGDYIASEDDNVLVQGISQDKYALGYFGLAYYLENQDILKVVPIDSGKSFVTPSIENILQGLYQPLSRPLFIYVNRKSAEKEEVEKFVTFYLENVSQIVQEVGYVPLPEKAYQLALERFQKRITGSLFGERGTIVGVSIEKLLSLEEAQ